MPDLQRVQRAEVDPFDPEVVDLPTLEQVAEAVAAPSS
jgi:hypothetical protein